MRVPAATLPLLLGIAVTLTLRGYQFGGGNHCVYLVAPLRDVHPELLANDWWTTHTLQYHIAYTKLTAALMRLNILEPTFLVFYLALVVLLHFGWLRIVLSLGFDGRTYLLSVLLHYLSAGGTGLGSYQFLQDSSFLPGNVANVALLWGLAFWIEKKTWPAAIAFAIASLFHLNHALIALLLWPAAYLVKPRPRLGPTLGGLTVILLFALPNLIPAARTALAHAPKMPLTNFVDLYVHLRHPHHYDPLAWPLALWFSFLWPIPLAVLAYFRTRSKGGTRYAELSRIAFTFTFFVALQLVALIFAGIVFVSEPLIQMSLFRFSIYLKLLSCIGAAAFLLDPAILARRSLRLDLLAVPAVALIALLILRFARPPSTAGLFVQTNLPALLVFVALLAAGLTYIVRTSILHPPFSILVLIVLTLFLAWNHWLGLRIDMQDDSDRDYLAVCDWARSNAPIDAVFLVPPNEQLFRYHAQRAIVINFKNVPQLSGEMPEWKERLEAILDQPLSQLPRRFDRTHAAIAARYDALPGEHLITVAQRYGARYLITARALPTRIARFEKGLYHLYDLN
jgi:hypothetical protein